LNGQGLCLIIAFYGASVASTVQAEGGLADQVVILAGHQSSYRTAAASLEAALKSAGQPCTLIDFPKDAAGRGAALKRLLDLKPKLIATGGTTVTMLVLDKVADVPVVAFMIPNSLDAPFIAADGAYRSRLACIASDVPLEIQIDLIRRLHPRSKTVGVLYSARSQRTVASLESVAKERGIKIAGIIARKDHFADAIEALNDQGCDSAFMIPDAGVYNSTNVQRLLLWGIRQKKPVWAFSANVVKAGALAGQFSKSHDIGVQTAEVVREILGGRSIAEIGLQFSRIIKSAVNTRTAEMIGISLNENLLNDQTERFGETQ